MMLRARRKDTGEPVVVLALASDRLALVGPEGHPELAILVPSSTLDPNPAEVALFEGLDSWTDRSLAARRGEA